MPFEPKMRKNALAAAALPGPCWRNVHYSRKMRKGRKKQRKRE